MSQQSIYQIMLPDLPKLSIVVPVYKVEKYIGRCLDSLLKQDLPSEDFEIVAIDDGSPDNSSRIIKEYQKKYSNIRLIHKPNGGLSSARNRGINEAKGKYIMFVDSDDYIAKNCLRTILDKIEICDADYLGYKVQTISNGIYGDYHKDSGFPTESCITGHDYLQRYTVTISSCCHIAKKQVYTDNNLRFTEGIINEDYEFMLKLYSVLKKMVFIPLSVYYYDLKTSGSITSTFTPGQYLKTLSSWETTLEHLEQWRDDRFKDNSVIVEAMNRWINNYKYRAVVALVKARLPISDKLHHYKIYKQLSIFNFKLSTLHGYRKFVGGALRNGLLSNLIMRAYK